MNKTVTFAAAKIDETALEALQNFIDPSSPARCGRVLLDVDLVVELVQAAREGLAARRNPPRPRWFDRKK